MIRAGRVRRQNALEPIKKLRHPVSAEDGRARNRFTLLFVEPLILVDRVVRIVHFCDDVCDRELHLMCPQAAVFIRWSKSDPTAEIQQDHRDVADDDVAVAQKWWSEWNV